ncbi:P-loop containing nucleoside triphosphate hydrolase protein [Polychaeton citri CBS 116435]|uniref:P-loop containing nucleoside triphosphate hydrolase protein n=1 Tax=Polychaeton citri CBS 116435 TaxID=1314669 RepID=A0A9P4UPM0_9PEZI|nr:P-loop containing nucleoside triphosphate hydrolase protein [Polychaeton citri CBS 116435]
MTPAASTPKEGEEKKEELVKVDPADVGMSAGYKYFYGGKEDKRGRFQWQTTIPEDLGQPAEDADSAKWALLVRNVKVYNDPRKVLALHSIVVQSPLLKDLLGEVLAGYPGVTVGLQRLEFSGKFEPLIHRWPELCAAIDKLRAAKEAADADADAADRVKHAELLHELLEKEFKTLIETSLDLRAKGVMTYTDLWTLFQPGQFVYSKQQGQDSIFRLHSSKYGFDSNNNPVFWLNCQFVEYDGSRFGTNKVNLRIPAYGGTRSINVLPALPLDYHKQQEEMKSKCTERGAKVEGLAGSHYRAYSGVAWRYDSMGQKEKIAVKGRIVIDTYGWNSFNPNYTIFTTPLHQRDDRTARGVVDLDADDFNDPFGGNGLASFNGGTDDDDFPDDCDVDMPNDGFFASELDDAHAKVELTDEQKMLCTPLVRGYALKEKMWLNFFVNAVQDVAFNTNAFDSLVLPSNQKELILGFTETQQSYRSQFDDVIEGKGRGIILLLCGPPGVGKTLTAESVAEQMKVPLYMMSAGDLGLDPHHVESKLQGILDMCTRWNAILLLDEADVFLEERSLHELERNKLVSIFLRVLEYYEGIMFLTTNRVQTFDAAFQSRIHISLEYPELSIQSRRTVWKNFLDQHDIAQAASRAKPAKPLVSAAKSHANSKHHEDALTTEDQKAQAEADELHEKRTMAHQLTPKDVDSLSQMAMNGRQIKNILKAAQLLATHRREGLGKKHIEHVLDVTQHLHNQTRESERTRSSIFN